MSARADEKPANVTDPDGPEFEPPPLPVGAAPDGGELGELFNGLDPNRVVVPPHRLKARANVGTTFGPTVAINVSEPGIPMDPPAPPAARASETNAQARRRATLITILLVVALASVFVAGWAIGLLGVSSEETARSPAPPPAGHVAPEPPSPSPGVSPAAPESHIPTAAPESHIPTAAPPSPRRPTPRPAPRAPGSSEGEGSGALPAPATPALPTSPTSLSPTTPTNPSKPLRHGSLVKDVTP